MKEIKPSLISPRFCSDLHELIELWREFGPANARFIAKTPLEWVDELRTWADDIVGAVEQSRAKEIIRRIKDGGYIVNSPYESKCWADSVSLAITNPKAFEFSIGEALDPDPLLSWQEAYEEIADSRRTGWMTNGAAKDVLQYVKPLADTANFIYWVDPYFNPFKDDNHLDFLDGVLVHLKNLSCRCVAIVSYNVGNELPYDLEGEMTRFFSSKLRPGLSLHWHIIRRSSGLELHDRCFITDKGAIDFGKGTTLSKTGKKIFKVQYSDSFNHKDLIEKFVRPIDLVVKSKSAKNIAVVTHS